MTGATFQVQIVGLDRMLAAFKKAPEIVEPILQQSVDKSQAILASETVPGNIPWITGNLASFKWTSGRLFGRWYPWVNYARAVQFGMPPSPGRYVPAIGKRLVDTSRDIGMWPGFRGRHYMEKILGASKMQINELFKNAGDVITEKLATE